MDTDFDASRISDHEPLSVAKQNQYFKAINRISLVGYLAVDAELKRVRAEIDEVYARCNRLAWGHLPINSRGPTGATDVQHAINSADKRGNEFGDRLRRAARECRSLRHYANLLVEAVAETHEEAVSEMHERANAEREAELRAAFESLEVADRERRYQEWRGQH